MSVLSSLAGFGRDVKSLSNTINSFGNSASSGPRTDLLREKDPNLLDTTKYAENLAKSANHLNIATASNKSSNSNTPINLDDFLKIRKAKKTAEFKKLQEEHGFYFSNSMNDAVLHEMRANEGYYLIGVNFNALFDLINYSINGVGEPLFDEDGNPVGVPEGDLLKDIDSNTILGETIDAGHEYEKLLQDKVGLRLDPGTVLKPEDVLDDRSRFKDIITEGKRYTGMSRKYLNPFGLHNMVRILDKYKKDEVQWLRTATAIDIVYRYMSRGASRKTFFSSRAQLDEIAIIELDEFFKTDHLFMTLAEITRLKNDLDFYRFNNPNNSDGTNTSDANTSGANTSGTNNGINSDNGINL